METYTLVIASSLRSKIAKACENVMTNDVSEVNEEICGERLNQMRIQHVSNIMGGNRQTHIA